MNTAIGAKVSILGQRFGRLLVIAAGPSSKRGRARWLCRCDCGTEKMLESRVLRGNHTSPTRSCGCLKREVDLLRQTALTHGHARHPRKNKALAIQKPSPTYGSWKAMRVRCTSKSSIGWKNYGGRGISVCERWIGSFENFLADMGERPPGKTLDRIDPNGDYTPDNCRWASGAEQRATTRLAAVRVASILDRFEAEAPDVIRRLRAELLGAGPDALVPNPTSIRVMEATQR